MDGLFKRLCRRSLHPIRPKPTLTNASTYPLLHIFGHSRPAVLLLDLRMGSVSPFMVPCWSHMAALKNLSLNLLVPDHKTQMLFLFIPVLAHAKKLPILQSEMLGSLSNDTLLLFGRSFWVLPAHQVLESLVISPLLRIALLRVAVIISLHLLFVLSLNDKSS